MRKGKSGVCLLAKEITVLKTWNNSNTKFNLVNLGLVYTRKKKIRVSRNLRSNQSRLPYLS